MKQRTARKIAKVFIVVLFIVFCCNTKIMAKTYSHEGTYEINTVSSTSFSSTTYKTKEKINAIYFRNWSGLKWTGKFKVSWKGNAS